jgi:hypothetical protein
LDGVTKYNPSSNKNGISTFTDWLSMHCGNNVIRSTYIHQNEKVVAEMRKEKKRKKKRAKRITIF